MRFREYNLAFDHDSWTSSAMTDASRLIRSGHFQEYILSPVSNHTEPSANVTDENNASLVARVRSTVIAVNKTALYDSGNLTDRLKKNWYSFRKEAKQFCFDLFLPVGYPHTVAPGYLEYQIYDSLQGLCSYLRGVISTTSVLMAAGVGNANATAMSAAMTWAVRDGLGMIGGLMFSYVASPHFDAHVKEFRILADILNDVGMTLDMALPFILSWNYPALPSFRVVKWFSNKLPSPYLVLTSLSTLCKVSCGISAGATKGNITDHFSICGNRADVNAKESTQETLVSLVGMALGVWLTKWLDESGRKYGTDQTEVCVIDKSSAHDFATCPTSVEVTNHHTLSPIDVQCISWAIFLSLTVIHVWANYVALQRLSLRTLNRERSKVTLQALVEECGRWVLCNSSPQDSSRQSTIADLVEGLPNPDSISESLWKATHGMFIQDNIYLGIRITDLIHVNGYCSHSGLRKNLVFLAEVSLLYNAALLISVTLNLDWAKSRAAGGQFESFPVVLRIIYFGMFFGMIFLMALLWCYRNISLNAREIRWARTVGYVFVVSTMLQLISKSAEERTNALPASIISLAFFSLSRKSSNEKFLSNEQIYLTFLCGEFKTENYIVFINGQSVSVMMRVGSSSRDELKAFLHSHILLWCMNQGNRNEPQSSWKILVTQRSHEIIQALFAGSSTLAGNKGKIDLLSALSRKGWDVSRLYLGFSSWKYEWDTSKDMD